MTTASPTSVDSTPIPDGTDPGGGVLGGRYRALTLGIVSVVLVIAFEATAVNTAMPTAARQLNGLGLYAFAFSGYFTTTLFALVVSGQWCDRRGPLRPLFTGIAVFGAGLVVAGTAPGMWVFVAGRAIQGLGGGLVIVALYVVVGRAYPERLRPSVFAAFSSAWVLPSIVGPLVSGAVTQHLGWRWVFLAVPVLILLPLAVMGPALRRSMGVPPAGGWGREHPVLRGADFDRRRTLLAAMAAVGAGLLQYAGQRRDLVGLLPGIAGAALLVPAVLGLLPERTLRAGRGLPTVILLRGVAAGAFFAAEAFIPLMMTTERDLSPTLAGLTLTSGGLSWALGSWLQGRPGAERYREAMIRGGFVLTAVAIAGAALVLIPAVPSWTASVAWGVGGVGMGLTVASVSVLMMRLSAPEDAGANSAALQMSDALGNVLLTGLAGVLFAALGGGSLAAAHEGAGEGGSPAAFAVILLVMASVAVLGALLSGRVRARA
ncbi:MFS transporter [Kitasatospora aureofaciens]|uniref:MFS transporter n=1 Tax=Kitasatospora aureofaciens TaxID=1894 RepID=UPI0005273FC6|nr:MFS transporter [Kitasatospora aureofaciens]HJD82307.1 MFS transporter [Kitasatospora aureofaciens]